MPLPDEIIKRLQELSKQEVKEIIKKLVETLDTTDIQNLIMEIQDELETTGILKIGEDTFDDWNNEEDSYYDNL